MNTNISNKIINLIKQNDSIYNSIISKKILYERIIITDNLSDDQKLTLLLEENENLKIISKKNRPVQQNKIMDLIKNEIKEEMDDEEENLEAPKKIFSTITNMEDIKRAFFNKDYNLFNELINNINFKYYRATYKFESDKDGAPEFIAKNLVKGFIRNLDDYRKYLMVCFRCYKNCNNYSYPSLWIINSNDSLENMIESIYEDYIFIEEKDKNKFLKDFEKLVDSENCIEEAYLH